MGTDPLAWINQEQEQALPEVPRSNVGRPRTIYREYEKTSQEGLQDNPLPGQPSLSERTY